MYLSRLWLNPMNRAVRRDMADPHNMHRSILRGFPEVSGEMKARAENSVLYRLDADRDLGRLTLYVQSKTKPNWENLEPGYLLNLGEDVVNPAIRSVTEAWAHLQNDLVLGFRLRANPTRRVDTKSDADGKRRNGKRRPLIGDDARIAWLARKAQEGGFVLVTGANGLPDLRIIEERFVSGRRGNERGDSMTLTFAPVIYEGRLRISDVEKFRQTLEAGVGPAKAYGFGLLTVATNFG